MSLQRVFVDTNIVLSGVLFPRGNEARVLALGLHEEIRRVIADAVILEARRVLRRKFAEEEHEFEDLLAKGKHESVAYPNKEQLEAVMSFVRDPDDVPVLASILLAKPDVALTGDKDLLTDEVRAVAHTRRCEEYLESLERD
jgi:putative PIN family toxin of toxin-antitoxin system